MGMALIFISSGQSRVCYICQVVYKTIFRRIVSLKLGHKNARKKYINNHR